MKKIFSLIGICSFAFQVCSFGFQGGWSPNPLTSDGSVQGSKQQAQSFAPSTTSKGSINLAPSSAICPSVPNNGDFCWNGTNLYFYNGSAWVDILAGGSGAASSVSANSDKSLIISPTTGSVVAGINWDDLQAITGSSRTVNWYDINLLINNLTTTGAGVGNLKMYDSSGINWVDIQAASTIAASKTWTWPATDGTNGQGIITNGSGILSFGSVGSTINWQALPQIVQSYNVNWYDVNNVTNGGKINTGGVNWADMVNNTTTINWNNSQSMKALTVNGTGSAITGMGTCTSHTGVMACIGTGGCAGYVSAYTAYNNLTCNCC